MSVALPLATLTAWPLWTRIRNSWWKRRASEALARYRRLHFLLVDVEVRVDVLHVVVIFQRFDHPHHLLRLRPAQLDVILRYEADFCGRRRNTGSDERFPHLFECL